MRSPGWSLVLVVGILATGCAEKEPVDPRQIPLETEEVGAGFDDGLSLEADAKGRPRKVESAGVVPGDFPSDFPIHQPSTVIDFGAGFVEFSARQSPAAVRDGLRRRAVAAGWSEGPDGFSKSGRSVRLEVTGDGELARIRVEYP
jgi:hypothetical protein